MTAKRCNQQSKEEEEQQPSLARTPWCSQTDKCREVGDLARSDQVAHVLDFQIQTCQPIRTRFVIVVTYHLLEHIRHTPSLNRQACPLPESTARRRAVRAAIHSSSNVSVETCSSY